MPADDAAVVLDEDHLGLVEQRAGTVERPAKVGRKIGPERGVRMARERQLMAGGPEDDLEDREEDDADRNGCARTSDSTQPSTPETSVPLGGVSAQTSVHASTTGRVTNQTSQ